VTQSRNPLRAVIRAVARAGLVIVIAIAAGCGGGDGERPGSVVLVTHDSFVVSDDVRRAFERESGTKLRILQSGDAGEMLTKALLTAGNPQGDVLFGVDSNLLSRSLEGDLFEPYAPDALDRVPTRYVLDREHRAIPIDHGEVCLNYDRAWFAERDLSPPTSLDDLVRPELEGLLVAENPATSTPGLAFLLATIARYGENNWQEYWRRLRANDVLVVDGWEEAYNVRFSGSSSGTGDRPIVVSYASSPAAEVIFRSPRPKRAPTAVVADSCIRQIEFAGILRGTDNEEGARALIDFMLSRRFQEDVPLSMFVYPVVRDATVPSEFKRFAVEPPAPLELDPDEIEENRDRWVKEWTAVVLR
jgi:thiamine transport system substrate-binding protein